MLYILHVNSQNLLFFLNNILLREIKKTVIKHNLHCSVNVKNWLRFFCKIYEGAFLNQSFPLYYIQEIRKNYVFFVKYSHCLTRSSERIFNPMRYTAIHSGTRFQYCSVILMKYNNFSTQILMKRKNLAESRMTTSITSEYSHLFWETFSPIVQLL